MQGKVELCGVNTSKLPLLKNAEMRELIAAAQSGDSAARDKLINGNLRLVLSVIQKLLRPQPECAVFNLRRADDIGRATAISA